MEMAICIHSGKLCVKHFFCSFYSTREFVFLFGPTDDQKICIHLNTYSGSRALAIDYKSYNENATTVSLLLQSSSSSTFFVFLFILRRLCQSNAHILYGHSQQQRTYIKNNII